VLFFRTETVPERNAKDVKKGRRRSGAPTVQMIESRRELRSGTSHKRRCKVIARKAIGTVDSVGRSDALEPLKQSQGLWVIGEAVEGDWERRIGRTFDNVSHFKNVLAGARRKTRKLIIGSDVIDERIVQSFAKLVGDGQNIGKDRGISKNRLGDVGIEPCGEGERLHEHLVVGLVCLVCSMEPTDAAINGLLCDKVTIDGVAGDKHWNCVDAEANFIPERSTRAESDFLQTPGSAHARGNTVQFPNQQAE
jgi:hypothetical protein